MQPTIEFTLYEDDGSERTVALPARYCVCPSCDGRGQSSAYLGAICASDREPGGAWDDPDDFAAYMRGDYDRPCERCSGRRVVAVVDAKACDPTLLARYREHLRDMAEYERECAAERRMGA